MDNKKTIDFWKVLLIVMLGFIMVNTTLIAERLEELIRLQELNAQQSTTIKYDRMSHQTMQMLDAYTTSKINEPKVKEAVVKEVKKPEKSKEPKKVVKKKTTSNKDHGKWQKVRALLTAYCPCQSCSEGHGRNTATGKLATEGRTIAVDPRKIPYGTKVKIDGHTYVAEDCGGMVNGYHIDVHFSSHDKVNKFGKKYKTIYIERR